MFLWPSVLAVLMAESFTTICVLDIQAAVALHELGCVCSCADESAITSAQEFFTTQLLNDVSAWSSTNQSVSDMLSTISSVQTQMATLQCAGIDCGPGVCVVRDLRAVCMCGDTPCESGSAHSNTTGTTRAYVIVSRCCCYVWSLSLACKLLIYCV